MARATRRNFKFRLCISPFRFGALGLIVALTLLGPSLAPTAEPADAAAQADALVKSLDALRGSPESLKKASQALADEIARAKADLESTERELRDLRDKLATPTGRKAALERRLKALQAGGAIIEKLSSEAPSPTSPPAATTPTSPAAEPSKRGLELYGHVVAQVLETQCAMCHGHEDKKAKLDVTSREALLKGGEQGPAIVPGKSADSLLYRLVARLEEPAMPYKKPKLPDETVAAIKEWIDEGAPFADGAHPGAKPAMKVADADRDAWAFRPLPKVEPPSVKGDAWPRTPADRFILAKLEEKGIAPNNPADRRTLIRRAYFDLIGLPPSPEEVDAFVADPDPAAWDKLVDRLLDNPHFGERWARHWLDVARFAESHGYEHDYDRPYAYHYRDFVIKAFNMDMPYDQFVKWQLAGDEFEPENQLAVAATGFLAAGVHSTQITLNQVEKERYNELDDMAATMGTAMLGLTVGCARCHDHKYDPIPTRDYYRLISNFTTTVRSEMDVNPDPDSYRQAKSKYDREHAPVLAALAIYEQEALPGKFKAWLGRDAAKAAPEGWRLLAPESAKSEGGATLSRQEDASLVAEGENPDFDVYTIVARTDLKAITSVRLEALSHPSLVKGGPGRAPNDNIALSDFRVNAAPANGKGDPVEVHLTQAHATFEQKGLPASAAIDADKKSAWAVDPEFGKDHAIVFEPETPFGFEGGTILTFTLEFKNNAKHAIGRPRISVGAGQPALGLDADAQLARVRGAMATLAAKGEDGLSAEERDTLFNHFRERDAKWRDLSKKERDHAQGAPKPQSIKVLASSEGVPAVRLHTQGGDFLPQTHILKRGDPNQKDEVAEPGYLTLLERSPDMEKHWREEPPPGWRTSYRRRSMANWITDVDQGAGPLLARVIVNRLWQRHLGRGLVATPSDFGKQGGNPSHPELVDWLAGELVRGGWRLKPLHKLIMTSAAYMESSESDEKKAALDRENSLFWRRPRRRLEAEIIRDAMLATSGLLDPEMFGPGTLDASMKRRSVYFFVKRSKLIPMMTVFDAPDTLGGMPARQTTTVAPQALILMNSPTALACAGALAKRIDLPATDGWDTAIRRGYRLALAREPEPDELAACRAFANAQAASYLEDGPEAAHRRALADLGQAILSLNEFVYVD